MAVPVLFSLRPPIPLWVLRYRFEDVNSLPLWNRIWTDRRQHAFWTVAPNHESQGAGESRMTRIRKAIFPVAGLGTRFLPATKAMPKEMLPVVDRPLIQHVVYEARYAA